MRRKSFAAIFLATLLAALTIPAMANPTVAETTEPTYATVEDQNGWKIVKTDVITILFPRDGRKPMFLWWRTNETDKIYVVKYQGLIEYFTFSDDAFYKRKNEALAERIRERLEEGRPWNIREIIRNLYGLYIWRTPLLPFSAGNWTLSGPQNITKNGEIIGLAFNFTLGEMRIPHFEFANGNIIIRCRFYYKTTTESVDNIYNYTVNAGELKMDFVVQNWEWNIDKIKSLIAVLREYGINISVPNGNSGLALWINLASIDLDKLGDAENNPEGIESMSTASNVIVEDRRVPVRENKTLSEDERPITTRKRLNEHYRLRFAKETQTLPGFFKFVASAKVTDPVSGNVSLIDVKAAYISAGAHMRLFLCYPYFGNKTLEHDPSLGLEAIPSLISPQLVLILVGTVAVIAAVVLVARWQRKPINVVGAQ